MHWLKMKFFLCCYILQGVITRCLLPEAGVYELDDRLTLYLTHSNLSNQGRGLRVGAEVEITDAHILKLSTPPYKVTFQSKILN